MSLRASRARTVVLMAALTTGAALTPIVTAAPAMAAPEGCTSRLIVEPISGSRNTYTYIANCTSGTAPIRPS